MSQPTSKDESNLCHPPSKICRFSSVVATVYLDGMLDMRLCYRVDDTGSQHSEVNDVFGGVVEAVTIIQPYKLQLTEVINHPQTQVSGFEQLAKVNFPWRPMVTNSILGTFL